METTFTDTAAVTCESCGRSPARQITVRRHVGMLIMQQFISLKVTACRPCGRRLIRSYTGTTLWQGWWGMISFFFNWFVLMANAWAWFRLGRIDNPSLSGMFVPEPTSDFADSPSAEEPAKRRSRLRRVSAVVVVGLLGLLGLATLASGWDSGGDVHEGAHGAPVSVGAIERAMANGEPFVDDDGASVVVQSAGCTGGGEPVNGGYTHFQCFLMYDNGASEDVMVHVLEDGDLYFAAERAT